jgi:hypothetical protein
MSDADLVAVRQRTKQNSMATVKKRLDRYVTLVAAALAVSTTIAAAQSPAQNAPQAIACGGPFAKDSSRAKLVASFGAANVTDQEVDGAEGSTELATVLFAKDPTRRVEVAWNDANSRARPASVSVKAPSAWTGPEGIRVGMALADVAQLNGAPISINGFEWDYGGYAMDLKGKLAKLSGGCSVMLRFSPGVDISGKSFRSIIGDKRIRSDNAVLLSAKPTLAEWSLIHND